MATFTASECKRINEMLLEKETEIARLASIIDRINARCLPACNSATNPAAHQLAYDILVITGERTKP